MKKTTINLVVAAAVLVIALIGVKVFLIPPKTEAPDVSDPPAVTSSSDLQDPIDDVSPDMEDPVKTYDNGIASFVYDSTVLYFDEIPSDDENGIPMTSFLPLTWTENNEPIYSSESLPRVDVMPLTVSDTGDADKNFYNITEQDWETLSKVLVLGYYATSEQERVQVELSNTVLKVDGTTAKMYVGFNSTLEGGHSMSGAIRLVAKGTNAVVTLALTEKGDTLPQEMHDLYMSVDVHDPK